METNNNDEANNNGELNNNGVDNNGGDNNGGDNNGGDNNGVENNGVENNGEGVSGAQNRRSTVIRHTRDEVDIANPYIKPKKLRTVSLSDGTRVSRNLFGGNYLDYVIPNPNNLVNFNEYLDSVTPTVEKILKDELDKKKQLKSNLFFVVHYVNSNDVSFEFAYKTTNGTIINDEDIDYHVSEQVAKLNMEIDTRELAGSGYTVKQIKHLEVRVSKVKHLAPASGFIPLPRWVKTKGAVVNVRSNRDDCFKLCILASFNKSNKHLVQLKNVQKYEKLFNFDINFPAKLVDVKRFCALNDVSINVYGILEEDEIYPIHICKEEKEQHFNLLYLSNNTAGHYCLITSLSRLLTKQLSKAHGRRYFCNRCLLRFYKQSTLDKHKSACGNEKLATLKLPEGKTYYKFDSFHACQKNLICITLDMESVLRPISTCIPTLDKPFTTETQLHQPVSFGAYLVCEVSEEEAPSIPRGYFGALCRTEDELENELFEYFYCLTLEVRELFDRNFAIDMSEEDERNFQAATECYICHKALENVRVKDHNHYSRFQNYRGAAHPNCNLQNKRNKYIPVYVQSLASYDSHFLLQIFSRKAKRLQIIPCTLEKYLSFSVWINDFEVRFLDSYRLLGTSLAEIREALPKEMYIETRKAFDSSVHSLLLTKGPFPYNFLSDVSRLDHPTLPEKSWFDNDLNEQKISESEYKRAQDIWKACNCKTFADFLNVYQKSDTVQLMDCILYIRSLFWDKFLLEVSAFFSLPHLSISCMLKHTGVEIELMGEGMDEEFEMVRRSAQGGYTLCGLRYVEAKDNTEIFYTDACGLYSKIMWSMAMPLGDYEFVASDSQDWGLIDAMGDFGYFLEADFSFPPEKHDFFNCLPPIAERKKPPGCSSARLINDLHPKKDFVLTLAHFQLVIKLGVKCDKISRVLRFRQSNYLAKYIEILSQWRREAKSNCESNFFKMSMNSLYGKFNEVLERRRVVKLVKDEKQLAKLVVKGTFVDRHILNFRGVELALVEMCKGVIKQTRPNIVGCQILSFSKVYMLNFWYNVLKPTFENKSLELVMMDTDSFLFKVESDTFHDDLLSIKEHFDFSNLDKSHKLYSNNNAKKLGFFKDESAGKRILAVCAPRTKCYSIRYDDKELKKLKGVQKSFVKNHLHFEDYKKCVLENKTLYANFKNIISRQHTLYTVTVNKLALEATDRKRVILEDGVHTKAYGHHELDEDERD